MIDNFSKIYKLIPETKNCFYLLQVIKRSIDNNDITHNKVIKSFFIENKIHLEKLKERIIKYCEEFKARCYIITDPKDKNKFNENYIKNISNTGNLLNIFQQTAFNLIPEKNITLLDFDFKDIQQLNNKLNQLNKYYIKRYKYQGDFEEAKKEWLLEVVETYKGFHIIMTDKMDRGNIENFRNSIYRNPRVLLYYPDSLKDKKREIF